MSERERERERERESPLPPQADRGGSLLSPGEWSRLEREQSVCPSRELDLWLYLPSLSGSWAVESTGEGVRV